MAESFMPKDLGRVNPGCALNCGKAGDDQSCQQKGRYGEPGKRIEGAGLEQDR